MKKYLLGSILGLFVLLTGALAGSTAAKAVVSLITPTFTTNSNTVFYVEPSVTVNTMARAFEQDERLVIVDTVTFKETRAVMVKEQFTAQDKEGLKYLLVKGDRYQVVENKPTTCIVRLETFTGAVAQLELPKTKLAPVDEGHWQRVMNKRGQDGWVQVASSWPK